MDTNKGRFLEEDDKRIEAWMKRISVGEIIKIKDKEYEVVEINDREIKLKLLSFQEQMSREFAASDRLRSLRSELYKERK